MTRTTRITDRVLRMVGAAVLAASAALVLAPGLVQAQASQVTATATIAPYAAVSGSGDLSFGVLDRGGITVDPTGGSAAQRTVNFNHNVRVTFTGVPSALMPTSGSGAGLPVTLTCAVRTGAAWSAATDCAGAELDLDVGATTTEATLGIGGSITAAAVTNAVAGTYEGTLTIVVTAR
ncbi:MAG TPA: hypothetical protein VK929_14150 [Longimicrobiales bacterium]|nr:hypothetical protein [Longimicrobiales bacterium]